MNPIFAEARTTVDGMWIMGAMTVAFLVFFIGWTLWAYWPSRRAAMEEAAMLPFDDEYDGHDSDGGSTVENPSHGGVVDPTAPLAGQGADR